MTAASAPAGAIGASVSGDSSQPRALSKTRSGRKNDPASLSKSGFINPRRICFARAARETPILRALMIRSGRGDSIFDQIAQCQPWNGSNQMLRNPAYLPGLLNSEWFLPNAVEPTALRISAYREQRNAQHTARVYRGKTDSCCGAVGQTI